MAKIFVSYSRKDSVVARKLIQALKDIQQDVWVDWEDIPPAVDWLEQIFRGIEGSDAFIFLISPDSIASEVCKVEIGRAAENNKRIIPVVVRDVETKNVIETIRSLNWTFIREPDKFEEGVAKVKIAIELDLPWVEEHNRLQARALEWHRKKDPSLLLRGRDLRNAQDMIIAATSKDPTPTVLQKTYIDYSSRDERRRTTYWIATAIAVIIMAVLAGYAWIQRQNAEENAKRANANAIAANISEKKAVKNADLARRSEREARIAQVEAEDAREEAERQKKIAEAERSVARAQIRQSTGELYTSTLLAIDSWLSIPSPEGEEILRQNISLLPIPVEQMRHAGRVHTLEFNSDKDSFITTSADGTACAWKAEDGTELFCATSPGSVNDAVFSPDGNVVVTADDLGNVQVINAQNGNIQDRYELGVTIRDIDFHRNNKFLALARDDGKVTIIDVNTRKSYSLQANGRLMLTSFSPDGVWVAAGSSSGGVTIWNMSEPDIILTAPSHKDEVLTIEFSPNSRFLVSGGKDKFAYVSETATGEELLPIANEDAVEDIAFSPDGSWFVTASDDRRIRVWDTFSGRERVRMLQDGVVKEVQVSSNGQLIATTGDDRTVRLWNAFTGTEIFQIPLEGNGSALGFGKDSSYLMAGDERGEINIWDISAMPAPESYLQFSGFARDVQFSQSGDILAVSDDNRVWLRNPRTLSNLTTRLEGAPSLTLKGNIRNMAISPDSKWLGVSTELGNVILYDINKKSGRTLKQDSLGSVLAFSPDSLQLITGDSGGNVQAWEVSSAKPAETIIENGTGVLSFASSPELLAIGMKDKIALLDWKSGQRMPDIEIPGEHEILAFNADGSLLASANSSGQIHVWKFENGEFEYLYAINKEPVYSMAFNPTNDQLAIGSTSKAYLIDPATGEEIARIRHKDPVNGVSISPDGNILASASFRAVQFWDVTRIENITSDNLVEAACSRLTANFDQAQWTALFGGEPYTKLCENLP